MKFISLVFILFISCANLNHPNLPAIHRYTRNSGSNNGNISYFDDVVIENYRNRTITIDSFVKIAYRYMDTVTADHPVAIINFIGKNENTDLPSPRADNYSDISDYYLVDVGFNNSNSNYKPNGKLVLTTLGIYRNGEYDQLHSWDSDLGLGKANLDSLLSSKLPLDNNFKW